LRRWQKPSDRMTEKVVALTACAATRGAAVVAACVVLDASDVSLTVTG